MKRPASLLLLLIILLPALAQAAATPTDYNGPVDQVAAALTASSTKVMNQLTGIAFTILFSLSMLKFTIMGYSQIVAGDIEMTIGKYARAFIWLSFVVWVMTPAAQPVRDNLSNGADFIQRTVDYFLSFATDMSTKNGGSFTAGDIMLIGLSASHNIIFAVGKAATGSVENVMTLAIPNLALFTALMLMTMNIIVLITCGYIALKVFMVKLDAAIVIAISPLSFSLMGLDALKEQGLAPFKNLLTIIYRIVILAAIVGAMTTVSDSIAATLDSTSGQLTDIWTPLLAAIFGFVILAYLAHRSDAIAASLSSGQSMFSSGDLASSVAAGVAVGAAVASGGAAAAGAGSKASESMSDVMKNMAGGGGTEVKNAQAFGFGGQQPAGSAPARPANSTNSSSDASANSPPRRPAVSGGMEQGGNAPTAQSSTSSSDTGAPARSEALGKSVAPSGNTVPGPSSTASSGTGEPLGSGEKSSALSDASSVTGKRMVPAGAPVRTVPPGMNSNKPPTRSMNIPADGVQETSAGIGAVGEPSAMEKKMDGLIASMDQPKRKSFGEQALTANEHLAKEQTAVHAHVNVNAHD